MADPLMTVTELAAILRVPAATLYRWRYAGEGPPAYRVGRYLRYRRREVEAWIEAQRAKARTAAP